MYTRKSLLTAHSTVQRSHQPSLFVSTLLVLQSISTSSIIVCHSRTLQAWNIVYPFLSVIQKHVSQKHDYICSTCTYNKYENFQLEFAQSVWKYMACQLSWCALLSFIFKNLMLLLLHLSNKNVDSAYSNSIQYYYNNDNDSSLLTM